MFGLKIAIFKKNKGLKVEPEMKASEETEDKEYKKWKREEERRISSEKAQRVWEMAEPFIEERIKGYVDWFKRSHPQPFSVGEKVIYNYYGGGVDTIGWFGNPCRLTSEFNIPELDGPFKVPVHKIWVEEDKLRDLLERRLPFSKHFFPIEDELPAMWQVEHRIRKCFDSITNKDNLPLVEWAVDFDWHTLKFPYDDSNKDESVGYLDLKWGGFSAVHFINANTPYAKKQRKIWKKERVYKQAKAEMESALEKMREELEIAKNNLI